MLRSSRPMAIARQGLRSVCRGNGARCHLVNEARIVPYTRNFYTVRDLARPQHRFVLNRLAAGSHRAE